MSKSSFEEEFPVGTRVQLGEEYGVVEIHVISVLNTSRPDGLKVRLDSGRLEECSYSSIDLSNPSNSLLRKEAQ